MHKRAQACDPSRERVKVCGTARPRVGSFDIEGEAAGKGRAGQMTEKHAGRKNAPKGVYISL